MVKFSEMAQLLINVKWIQKEHLHYLNNEECDFVILKGEKNNNS